MQNLSSHEMPLLHPASVSAMFLFVLLSILLSKSCILCSIVSALGCNGGAMPLFPKPDEQRPISSSATVFPVSSVSSSLTYEIDFAYIYQHKMHSYHSPKKTYLHSPSPSKDRGTHIGGRSREPGASHEMPQPWQPSLAAAGAQPSESCQRKK